MLDLFMGYLTPAMVKNLLGNSTFELLEKPENL